MKFTEFLKRVDDTLIRKLSRQQNMQLTNEEIDILVMLIDHRLDEVYSEPEDIKLYWKPEVLENIKKKLDKMLFS